MNSNLNNHLQSVLIVYNSWHCLFGPVALTSKALQGASILLSINFTISNRKWIRTQDS